MKIDPQLISVISLMIAALAVVVGPLVYLYISKNQSKATLQLAKQQLLGPMRQAWINELRELVVEVTSNCLHYWSTGTYEDLENDEYQRIIHIQHKVRLMINPAEEDHAKLFKEIESMVNAAGALSGKEDKVFFDAYNTVISTSQAVLKREWDVVKKT
jgi:hypothetical protein